MGDNGTRMNADKHGQIEGVREILDGKFRECYDRCMGELGRFFEKEWVRDMPKLFFVDSRKILDKLIGRETEEWEIAIAYGNGTVFLLAPEAYEKDSCHEYSDYRIFKTINHELAHCFWDIFTRKHRPLWLSEGLAVHLAGQIDREHICGRFSGFLECYDSIGMNDYFESGFAVRVLVERFGNGKILELLRGLDSVEDQDGFYGLFEKVYGFRISYEEMNKLLGRVGE